MRTRHATQIRLSIYIARNAVKRLEPYDDFSRGMNYRLWQPKGKLAAAAYRRTWHKIELRCHMQEAR